MRSAIGPKILFLDFDGVLHPSLAAADQYFCRMPLLEQALGSGFCEIVISSSWRFHHSFDKLRGQFPDSIKGLVVGRTGEAVIGQRYARHQEIAEYLATRPIADWRALDDSAFEFPEKCAQLILCNASVGFAETQEAALGAWLRSAA